MSFVDGTTPFVDGNASRRPLRFSIGAGGGVVREAALVIGKAVLIGCGAALAFGAAHRSEACELRRHAAPAVRKAPRIIEFEPVHSIMRQADLPTRAPSRRMILQ